MWNLVQLTWTTTSLFFSVLKGSKPVSDTNVPCTTTVHRRLKKHASCCKASPEEAASDMFYLLYNLDNKRSYHISGNVIFVNYLYFLMSSGAFQSSFNNSSIEFSWQLLFLYFSTCPHMTCSKWKVNKLLFRPFHCVLELKEVDLCCCCCFSFYE